MLPTKPPTGSPCNGCGLCCIAEQCRISLELFGAAQVCPALEYEGDRFWCGIMRHPEQYGAIVDGFEDWEGASAKYYRTLIGAEKGCDSDCEC